jgi:lipopolysaccharide/colanic/teichoic acid biosynthesis glycosyltransferase
MSDKLKELIDMVLSAFVVIALILIFVLISIISKSEPSPNKGLSFAPEKHGIKNHTKKYKNQSRKIFNSKTCWR